MDIDNKNPSLMDFFILAIVAIVTITLIAAMARDLIKEYKKRTETKPIDDRFGHISDPYLRAKLLENQREFKEIMDKTIIEYEKRILYDVNNNPHCYGIPDSNQSFYCRHRLDEIDEAEAEAEEEIIRKYEAGIRRENPVRECRRAKTSPKRR